MWILLFLICACASIVGAIVGVGGGVMIKPITDMLGVMPVSAVSFLSSCCVMAMACASLLRSRGSGIKLETRTSVPLALGAAIGGVIGKMAFEAIRSGLGREELVGGIQAVVLATVLVLVLVYVCRKDKIRSHHIKSVPMCALTGLILGPVSSFLGIGGGPYIVAVLFYLFSMEAKQAAKNSNFIILLSQLAGLSYTAAMGRIPELNPVYMVAMVSGGVIGGIAGSSISRRMNNSNVETLLKITIAFIILICLYNCYRFFGA